MRYRHTYLELDNGEGLGIPFLQTLSQPSPTGSGLSTRTFNYTSQGYIDNIVDGNGNRMVFTQGTGNTTQVSVKDPQGNVVRSWSESFDNVMNGTGTANASGQTKTVLAFADGNAPFQPSSITKYTAAGTRVWNFTYDHFGNVLTATTPKGTTTTCIYGYTQFALGELLSLQEGSKTPTAYSYYEPSGLVHEIDAPTPGTSGLGSTQATTFAYNALGNVTQIVKPGTAPRALARRPTATQRTEPTAMATPPTQAMRRKRGLESLSPSPTRWAKSGICAMTLGATSCRAQIL